MTIKFTPGKSGEKFRPNSSGSYAAFDSLFCERCKKDAQYRNTEGADDGCPIIADSFVFEVHDDEYPSELIYGEDGQPVCTAFQEAE